MQEPSALNSSLSSQFFNRIKEEKITASLSPEETPPPPPPIVSVMENKRRETNAAVALMQEKLQAMGILNKTSIRLGRKSEKKTDESLAADELGSSASDASDVIEEKEIEPSTRRSPPKTVQIFEEKSDSKDEIDEPSVNISGSKNINNEIIEKMDQCRTATR